MRPAEHRSRYAIAVRALVAVLLSTILIDLAGTRVALAQRVAQVPDIVGLAQDRADAAIARAGLTVGDVRSTENQAPKGTVISQSPLAGSRVQGGSRVAYVVSTGPDVTPPPPATPAPTPRRTRAPRPTATPQGIVVPEVRGLLERVAVARIRAARLFVESRLRVYHGSIAAGRAVRTEPVAGTALGAGSGVTLYISRGPRLTVVPEIVGRPQGAARRIIDDAGLVAGSVRTIQSSEPMNVVLEQDPKPGSRVFEGSAVAYTISSGPASAVVPDVRGLTRAEAEVAIEDSGLVIERTGASPDASIPPGDATGTDPRAGTVVDAGSSVTLTLSSGAIVAADDGSSPETILLAVVSFIILAAIVGAGVTRLTRGLRPSGPVPSIRTVSHADRAPRIRIRGGRR
jgi:serine/threonine-protein kinase